MISLIFRMKIKEGTEDQALELLGKMAESVQAQESGTLAYLIHRSQEDPSEIVFFEVYDDDDALQAHGQTPHMGEFRASFADLFDTSTVKLERLERLGGFARPGAG